MSFWSCSPLWTVRLEHDSIPALDEENNKPTPTGAPGFSRHLSRLLNRVIRVVNVLLILGLLTFLYVRPSKNLTPSMLNTPILDLPEPGIDSNLSHDWTMLSKADWSKYAYIQYATSSIYLCNSLMIFESLHRLRSKAERLMMYPEGWSVESESSDAQLLRKARDRYNVKLQPVHIQRLDGDIAWGESFTKLLPFNQTQYQRVISLDSDANVLQVSVSSITMCDEEMLTLCSLWMSSSSYQKLSLPCLERIG
jgi:alpha-N-acetylglucosamine transferase